MPILNRSRFYGWINLIMVGLVMLISMGVVFSFQIFIPILYREFGWSRGLIGGAVSVSMLMLGLTSPLSGAITARYGSRVAIIIGHILLVIGLMILSFQYRPWHLYVGLAVMEAGCGIGGMVPAMTLANNWFLRKRPFAMSIVNSSVSVGGFIMIPITTILVDDFGWRNALLILAIIVLIFTAAIPGIMIRNRPEELGQIPDGIGDIKIADDQSPNPVGTLYNTPVDFTLEEAIKTWALWMIIIVYGSVQYIISMLMTHQIAFLDSIGIKGIIAASAAGLQSGVGVIGALGVGMLGIRINMRTLAIICVAILGIGMVIVLVAKNIPLVFLYNVVLGLGIGAFTTSSMALLSVYYGRTHFPEILGFVTPFWMLLGSSGAGISGVLYDMTGSYLLPFLVATMAVTISLVLIGWTKPPSLKNSKSFG